MKKLFIFLGLALFTQYGVAQVVIHGEGSQLFYIVNETGYYQIQSQEIWLHPDGSQSFASPTYSPVAPPQDEDRVDFPIGKFTCAWGKEMMQNSTGGSAECGPTKVEENLATGIRTMSCDNFNADLCKMETWNSANVPITIWAWMLNTPY